MVLFVVKYDIHPDKAEAYNKWAKSVIPSLLAVPGIIELRAYRPVTGTSQIVVTMEFADLTTWATYCDHEEIQKITNERRTFTVNEVSELWGPSPNVPKPIRPGE